MIQIALHRTLSWVIACSVVRQCERRDTSHGWRDKSADVRRAHVVGWVEIFRRCVKWLAVASRRNVNKIKSKDAIALLEDIVTPS